MIQQIAALSKKGASTVLFYCICPFVNIIVGFVLLFIVIDEHRGDISDKFFGIKK